MNKALERQVRRRAQGRCEYCRLPERVAPHPFQIDHIIARQHGGPTALDNLALVCLHCNVHKGPNLTGVDPLSGRVVRLYHPRQARWQDHFRLNEAEIVGLTPHGRATVAALAMNHPAVLAVRAELLTEGAFDRNL